jgi:hypothetical protein
MPLHSLFCVRKKLYCGMAALLCNTPCCNSAILKRIRNGRGRTRSPARSLVDLNANLFQN